MTAWSWEGGGAGDSEVCEARLLKRLPSLLVTLPRVIRETSDELDPDAQHQRLQMLGIRIQTLYQGNAECGSLARAGLGLA